ncbi:MAG: hypothetical protein M1495_06605 [Bacteroidetes bacterium]|nr:hypothetical protein [Bacteroidota bacterium]
MKRKIFVVVLSLMVLVLGSCKSSTVEAPIIPEVQPGRRDYAWGEDTLHFPQNERLGLGSIWGSSPIDIWAAGDGSLSQLGIWHFDGMSWQYGTSTPTFNQSSLWGTASNNIWMGNYDGYIWHYDGSSWQLFTKLEVARYKNFGIQRIWGKSANEVYAVGTAYNSYFNEENIGGVFRYNGKEWRKIDMPAMKLNFLDLRIANNGDMIIPAWEGAVTATKLVAWNGKEFKEMFSQSGTASFNVFNIDDKTFFNIGKIIYSYEGDGTYRVWKDFSGTDYYNKVLCSRNEKDFFVGSWALQGINHYNGTDLKLIYSAPNTRVIDGIIFEKDVLFILLDTKTYNTRILHGHL